MKLRFLSLTFILITITLITGCIEESPELVNPPSQAETVLIRFVNLASDQEPRSLQMGEEKTLQKVQYASTSEAVHPPADSAILTVLKNGNKEFSPEKKALFSRDLRYTYFALPTARGDTNQRPVDTLISVLSSTTIAEDNQKGHIKLFNANPDTDYRYSLRVGCQNGTEIISNVGYRSASLLEEIRKDSVALSLIRNTGNGEEKVGTFSIEAQPREQYIFIVYAGNDDKKEQLMLLDMLDPSKDAIISPLDTIEQQTSQIRVINLSDIEIDVKKLPDTTTISDDLSGNSVGKYEEITACASLTQNTIVAYESNSSNTLSSMNVSLEVMRRYTIVVYESSDNNVGMKLLSPTILEEPLNGRSIVRVFNTAQGGDREEITITLGARPDKDNTVKNFESGEVLAEKFTFGDISKSIFIDPGPAPIVLFRSEPKRLLYCTYTRFEPEQRYLLVETGEEASGDKMALINENDEDVPIEYLEKGVFTEIVNAIPGSERMNITLGDGNGGEQLSQAGIYFTESLATVVTEGDHLITLNGVSQTITADLANSDKRLLIIGAGVTGNTEIIHFLSETMGATLSNIKRRFINASKKYPKIQINVPTTEKSEVLVDVLPYGTASEVLTKIIERRESFQVIDFTTKDTIQRVDDISLPFGKNFSLIFSGDSTMIKQQEF